MITLIKVILIAKIEIVDTSSTCQNKIVYIKNLTHIYKYILTIFASLTWFFDLLAWRVGKGQTKFLGGGGEEKAFSSIILERETEIFMIQK